MVGRLQSVVSYRRSSRHLQLPRQNEGARAWVTSVATGTFSPADLPAPRKSHSHSASSPWQGMGRRGYGPRRLASAPRLCVALRMATPPCVGGMAGGHMLPFLSNCPPGCMV